MSETKLLSALMHLLIICIIKASRFKYHLQNSWFVGRGRQMTNQFPRHNNKKTVEWKVSRHNYCSQTGQSALAKCWFFKNLVFFVISPLWICPGKFPHEYLHCRITALSVTSSSFITFYSSPSDCSLTISTFGLTFEESWPK